MIRGIKHTFSYAIANPLDTVLFGNNIFIQILKHIILHWLYSINFKMENYRISILTTCFYNIWLFFNFVLFGKKKSNVIEIIQNN